MNLNLDKFDLQGSLGFCCLHSKQNPKIFLDEGMDKVNYGSYARRARSPQEEQYQSDMDFCLASHRTDGIELKLFVPTKGLTIVASLESAAYPTREGKDTALSLLTHSLVSINADISAEQQDVPYSKLVADTLKKQDLRYHQFAQLSFSSSNPSLVLVATGSINVYMTVFSNAQASYLWWFTNKEMQDKAIEELRKLFFYYKLPTWSSGVLTLQPYFLMNKWKRWKSMDPMKAFNNLEYQITNKIQKF